MIVDAHAHVWTMNVVQYPWHPLLGYVPDRPATVEDYMELLDSHHVRAAVLVQPSVYGWDHRYLFDSVAKHPARLCGVALLNADGDWSSALRDLRLHNVRGLRFNVISPTVASWIEAGKYERFWSAITDQGLPVAFQARAVQLEAVARFARRFPKLTMIIDHLGGLDPTAARAQWRTLTSLADLPGVFVKISGFHERGAAQSWSRYGPLILECVRAFGPERLMWGSDAPGALKASSYLDTMAPLLNLGLNQKELSYVLGRTAGAVFGIPEAAIGTDSR